MAGATIPSSLALTLSLPVALCSGTERRSPITLSFDICGRFHVSDTWYGVGGGLLRLIVAADTSEANFNDNYEFR